MSSPDAAPPVRRGGTPSQPGEASSSTSAAPASRADKFLSRRAQIDNSGKYKVVFGYGCVVHPYAVLKPTNGPIKIGEYCIIGEECVIENCIPSSTDMKGVQCLFPASVAKEHGQPYPPLIPPASGQLQPEVAAPATPAAVVPPNTLVIGNHNYFGPRVKIQGAAIGNCNLFEANSSVGIMAVIQDGCTLRANTRVTHDAFVPDFTVIEGSLSRWHINGAVMAPFSVTPSTTSNSTAAPSPSPAPPERDISSSAEVPPPVPGEEDESTTSVPADLKEPSPPSNAEQQQAAAAFDAPSAAVAYLKEIARHAEVRSRTLRRQLKD